MLSRLLRVKNPQHPNKLRSGDSMTKIKKYEMRTKDKVISLYLLVGLVVQLFMLFFFGNWFGLNIIMFLGFVSLAIAAILFLSSNVLKKEGGMEKGKGFITTKLVATGIYRLIRHPIYLSIVYVVIGFALISQHPVSLFFGLTLTLICYYFMIEEEKLTTEKFGKDYIQYMAKVPRSNLLIGLWRFIKRKE